MSFEDVNVLDRADLDGEHQSLHPLPWLAQFADGTIFYFDTEADACLFRREWRRIIGLNQLTGDPA